MNQSKFSTGSYVIFKQKIYQVISIAEQQETFIYSLKFVAFIQNDQQEINRDGYDKNIEAKESELQKFEYSPPIYPLGTSLKGGDRIEMIVFSRYREYRYSFGHFLNFPEDEMSWRV